MELMNTWYQFIYERNRYGKKEVVQGVRLYKSESDFWEEHDKTCRILKMIPVGLICD